MLNDEQGFWKEHDGERVIVLEYWFYKAKITRHGVSNPKYEVDVYRDGRALYVPDNSFSDLDVAKEVALMLIELFRYYGISADTEI